MPPFFGGAQVGVPLRPAKNNVRNAGQCFSIVNYSRPAPQSDDRREGRLDPRDSALAFERLHQRRFFSHLVGARSAVPVDVEVLPAAENVLAQKTSRVSIGNRLLHNFQKIAILAANVDVSGLRAHGQPGNHHAFNHGMRIVLENQTVFAGARLALVAIAQNIFRLGRLLGDE